MAPPLPRAPGETVPGEQVAYAVVLFEVLDRVEIVPGRGDVCGFSFPGFRSSPGSLAASFRPLIA